MVFLKNVSAVLSMSMMALSASATNVNINDLRIALDLSNAVFCEEDYGSGCISEYNFLGRSKEPATVNLYTKSLPMSELTNVGKSSKDNVPKNSELYPFVKSLSMIDKTKSLRGG